MKVDKKVLKVKSIGKRLRVNETIKKVTKTRLTHDQGEKGHEDTGE